jgi:hypothetical protein
MKAFCLFILGTWSLSGCLLFLPEPAEFPNDSADAVCIHDAEQTDDWSFKSGDLDGGVDALTDVR